MAVGAPGVKLGVGHAVRAEKLTDVLILHVIPDKVALEGENCSVHDLAGDLTGRVCVRLAVIAAGGAGLRRLAAL